jgi:pyridoxal phosphate enzyme (YggS family)
MPIVRSMTRPAEEIARNLASVRQRIDEACARSSRNRDEVNLVAVSKTFGPDAVRFAIEAGVRDFGENRVQELRDKLGDVGRDARWHMIGHLQSNKARDAVQLFNVVQSVDRFHLAEKLDQEARLAGKSLDVLVQVNIGEEPQKSGIAVSGLKALVEQVMSLRNLRPLGLMTIPPIAEDASTRRYFRRMRELRDELREATGIDGFAELSMGMTDDFEIAIEEGSTIVRVGRAIFGERN